MMEGAMIGAEHVACDAEILLKDAAILKLL
jgi:hypothetical protein